MKTDLAPIVEELDIITPRKWDAGLLRLSLSEAGINVSGWGRGPTEPFSEFLERVNTDHVEVRFTSRGPVLHSTVAVLFIQMNKDGKLLELVETKSEFTNGSSMGPRDFDGSLGETFRRGENKSEAIRRALKEELKWRDPSKYRLWDMPRQTLGPKRSEKYPGVWSMFYREKSGCLADPCLYEPEYVAPEKNKIVIFRWRERPRPGSS